MNAIRLIGWLLFGVIFPLFTLVSVPFNSYLQSSTNGLFNALLTGISYEDLLVVAFTLSAASAIDAVITGWGKYKFSLILGIFTLFITLGIMFVYFCVKDTPHSFHRDVVIGVERGSYVVAVFLSICCEICATFLAG